jgi:hypothetical protein
MKVLKRFLFSLFCLIYFPVCTISLLGLVIINTVIITPIYWIFTSKIVLETVMDKYLDFMGIVMTKTYNKLV